MNIKDYRDKELRNYVIANMLTFYIIGVFDGSIGSERIAFIIGQGADSIFLAKMFETAILIGIIYVYVFIIDSLVSGDSKHTIIFLGKKNMPGNNVFTRISDGTYKDARFSVDDAMQKYKDIYEQLPGNKDEYYENEQWYKLLKNYDDNFMVNASHRDFLLCRDMCTMSLWMLVIYFAVCIITCTCINIYPVLWLMLEFFVTYFATRIKSRRFVLNVIALDLAR